MTSMRAIIAGTRALITTIAAGGWVAMVIAGGLLGWTARQFLVWYLLFRGGQRYRPAHTHDVLEMSGSRTVWSEMLVVYAVKTATNPDNPQEVASMDYAQKGLLKEIFWAMNEVNYSTSTAP